MILQWTTSKRVLARIFRNIKGIPAEAMEDIPEWLAEAIGKLKTHHSLVLKHEPIEIKFYHGRLPCSAEILKGITYQGMRLRRGSGNPVDVEDVLRSISYVSNPEPTDESANWVEVYKSLPQVNELTYSLNYNKVETNIEEGEIWAWFWAIPTDSEGFPMIPDNEDYQEALYWYVRMMLIGTGWQDPVFDYGTCDAKWEKHAARAKNQITYPDEDKVKRSIDINTRLIPVQDYWETFGNSTAEGNYTD